VTTTAKYTRITSPAKVRATLRGAIIPVLRTGAYRVASDWQDSIPHEWPGQDGHVTGNSARSISVHFPSQLTATIGTTHLPAKALETGAKAHIIRAKKWRHGWVKRNTSALVAWPWWRGGAGPFGKWRVRREAHHPGVAAGWFGYRALAHESRLLLVRLVAAIASVS
jgi:hypothetical protein